MESDTIVVTRRNWVGVTRAFRDFFEGVGTVKLGPDELVFEGEGTRLALHRDGSSRSFMPLHDLRGTWDKVTFVLSEHEVRLWSNDLTYTYRVPRRLLG